MYFNRAIFTWNYFEKKGHTELFPFVIKLFILLASLQSKYNAFFLYLPSYYVAVG